MDNQELQELKKQQLSQISGPTGDERANLQQEKDPTTFLLTLAKGRCTLVIEMSMGQKSQQLEIVVPSSISIGALKKEILKALDKSSPSIPSTTNLVISYNSKELQENTFLFQSLPDTRNIIADN